MIPCIYFSDCLEVTKGVNRHVYVIDVASFHILVLFVSNGIA